MITYYSGNIFDSTAQTLVCPVNTMGAMGAGLAKQFKDRYMYMYKAYQNACYMGDCSPGRVWLYRNAGNDWTLCFPTKYDYALPSTLGIIEASFVNLLENIDYFEIESIAFPKLGCGLGDLNWADVKPLMEKYLSRLSERIPVEIYV